MVSDPIPIFALMKSNFRKNQYLDSGIVVYLGIKKDHRKKNWSGEIPFEYSF